MFHPLQAVMLQVSGPGLYGEMFWLQVQKAGVVPPKLHHGPRPSVTIIGDPEGEVGGGRGPDP